jgi:23S rRNA (cytidine1920-2'-O)/16S rRNA (cytidine1409-2'-O)-methyltransferase
VDVMAKLRLDVLLVEKGLFPSREKARTAIMSRRVQVDNKVIDKAGTQVAADADITITGHEMPYVSRGGYKLAKAIEVFPIPVAGAVMADIGASTGGFTDCALQNGAAKVYAVDVGYGQLAWSLRTDERVVVLEKTNARFLGPEQIPEPLDLITIDASFISLTLLLPALYPLLKSEGHLVALIKPQFEAGRDKVGKKGVVRDASVHCEVIEKVIKAAKALGFFVCGLDFSPVKGPEGNIEYLLWLSKSPVAGHEFLADEKNIAAVTDAASQKLNI